MAGNPPLAGGSVQSELELTGGEWLSGSLGLAEPVSRLAAAIRFAGTRLRKPPATVDLDGTGSEFDPALSGIRRRRQLLFDRLELPVGPGASGEQPAAATSAVRPEEVAGRG